MKRTLIIFFGLICTLPIWSKNIGSIHEVLAPQMIKVFNGDLFVVEDHQVYIYDLKTMKLKKKLGKSGQGPGEFNLDPSRSIVISVNTDYILAESRNKIIFFNHQGETIRELKKHPTILQTHPIKDRFAVLKIIYANDGDAHLAVSILDKDMKEIVEVYRQKFCFYKSTVHVMPDTLNCSVIDDHLIVEESPEGFVLKIFDSNGVELKHIKRDYMKREVLDLHREKALKELCGIPSMQRILERDGQAGLNAVLKESKLIYPENFPAISNLTTDGIDIYVQTTKAVKDKFEFLVFGKDGTFKKQLLLTETAEVSFLVRLQGDKEYFSFYKGDYFYLKRVDSGDDDEYWEVHHEKSAYSKAS